MHILLIKYSNNTYYGCICRKKFFKIKINKSYLRSTMSQERLSGLAILLIEKEMLEELKYKNLISNFASQKARKIDFK